MSRGKHKSKKNYQPRQTAQQAVNAAGARSRATRTGAVGKDDVLMTGTFQGHAKGYGFVTVEGLVRDLFIPSGYCYGVFDGDTVEVRLLPMRDGSIDMTGQGTESQRQEAAVTRVIEHAVTTIVGSYEKRNGQGYVTPDNKRIGESILIKKGDTLHAVNGHKVVVEITDYGTSAHGPQGRITEILGHMDDPGVDILSIIKSYNLPEGWPEAVREEVSRIPDHVNYNGGRLDLRDKIIVTIDGPDTKDIDDAISIERDGEDYILGVHIADVTNYVKEGTPLDKEALSRATSVYLVDRVIPMLPHELSNGICSLNQGEDRYALSCIMRICKDGTVLESQVVETVIRSRAKLSYPGVMRVFEGDVSEIEHALEMQGVKRGLKTRTDEIVRMLKRGLRLSKILAKKRDQAGAIDFEFEESEILLDEEGRPIDIVPHERNAATEMIEKFMVLANSCVAETFCKLGEQEGDKAFPFVYRTHGVPSEEKMAQLDTFIRNYGYRVGRKKGEDVTPAQIQALLNRLHGKPEENTIQIMVLRSMQRAEYTTSCDGHFGLALQYYCHFTSPIRRYPDLQIHRIIKEQLHHELNAKRLAHYRSILAGVCRHSSENERRADEAERETDKQKKAEYMAERLGEIYEGTVSGITGWGLYVALPNTVEGLIPVASMKDDYYTFDENHYILYGERSGRTYQLGQPITVQVAAVDVVARTIDFVVAGDSLVEPKGKRPHAKQDRRSDTGRPMKVRADGRPYEQHRKRSRHHGSRRKH